MPIVPLPLPPAVQARALLHHILCHADVAGRDASGRIILTLAVDAWTLKRLLAFEADAAGMKDADGEPEPDGEDDGPPVTGLDVRRPRRNRHSR